MLSMQRTKGSEERYLESESLEMAILALFERREFKNEITYEYSFHSCPKRSCMLAILE